jgi:hypothetical protein
MSKTATAAKFYRLLFLGCLTTTISCTQERATIFKLKKASGALISLTILMLLTTLIGKINAFG